MIFLSKFFCKENEYEPVGMFSVGHIVTLIIFLLIVAFCAYKCRKIGKDKAIFLTKIIAIVVTVLEIIKITIAFINGEGDKLDHWVPLYFCSMFIYAAWLAGYAKGKIADLGRAFVGTGGIIAGLSFLIFPTTSFTMYPLFHYFCMYSMVYHSLMVFLGITYLLNGVVKIDKKSFIDYVIFCSVLNILAIIVNSIPIYIHVDNVPTSGYNYPYPYYTNFMFLKRAGNIPVKILCDISDKVPVIFTILMFIICIFGTYFLIWLVVTIIEKIRGKKAYGENNPN
ncbi:putative membrane protein [Firmicutes bacterium CAG:313]|jgi:putative membrane protein|nr:putative membrane protein [Firmicutes bacterium CAG:313]